jgi:hypothetical protein
MPRYKVCRRERESRGSVCTRSSSAISFPRASAVLSPARARRRQATERTPSRIGVSAVLVNETRSLIAGEAVAGPIMEELHRELAADSRILQIDGIATMHLGPQTILMALTLRFGSESLDSSFGRRNTGNHFNFAICGETCRLCLCPAPAQRGRSR